MRLKSGMWYLGTHKYAVVVLRPRPANDFCKIGDTLLYKTKTVFTRMKDILCARCSTCKIFLLGEILDIAHYIMMEWTESSLVYSS